MTPRRATPPQKKRSGFPPLLLIGGALVIVVIAVAVAADLMLKSQGTAPAISGDRTAGDAEAPLTFVEYSDFQ